ncbi:MAG: hypothetical protein ACYSWQ_11635, partial [Planctomycetota bacterium]
AKVRHESSSATLQVLPKCALYFTRLNRMQTFLLHALRLPKIVSPTAKKWNNCFDQVGRT